eukprot:15152017-Alexandrium_andersonii.AAC.1
MKLTGLRTGTPGEAGPLGRATSCQPTPGAPGLKRPETPPRKLSVETFCAVVRAACNWCCR